ncbi:MAG: hypothetical protein ACRCX8_01280, partial [Sarcina sp.]
MKRLVVDFGNSNMKIAYRNEEGEIITHLIKSLATRNGLGTQNIVSYNNSTVLFGSGIPLVEQDKTKRRFVEESILLAAKLCDITSGKVELCVGLPLNLYKTGLKDVYQSDMSHLKSLKGDVDGVGINITIDSVKVFAEGFSAFIAYSRDITTT